MIDRLRVEAAVDAEYRTDIDTLREIYKKVAVRDVDRETLYDWLRTHSYLSAHDIARITGVCHRTVYKWRRQAGLSSNIKRQSGRRSIHNRPIGNHSRIIAPVGWDTNWVVDTYNDGHSVPEIARATGRSVVAIRRRLLKAGVVLRGLKASVRSRHRLCTVAWVFEHYVRRGLSKRRCARLAGVSRSTFSTWLDDLNIRARPAVEQGLIDNGTDLGKRISPKTKRHGRSKGR